MPFESEPRQRLVGAIASLSDAALNGPAGAAPYARRLFADAVEPTLLAHLGRDPSRIVQLRLAVADSGWKQPAAVRHLEWAPIGRARLEASLLGIPDELLDARPLPDEWTVRQQLAHVELTDIRYTLAIQYAINRRDDEPIVTPPEIYPPRSPSPDGTPSEPLAAILARLRKIRAEALEPLFIIRADRLQRSTEWHSADHTVGFRLHRFGQHDLEIATDIRATLSAAGFVPTRAMRIAAALRESWGEIESVVLGVPETLATSLLREIRHGDEQFLRGLER